MRFISPLISDARGSLGGSVAARNPSGVYLRARTAPSQPRTTSQTDNRALFTTATQTWRTLSASVLAGWMAYAETQTRTNTLGQRYVPSGFQLFVECMRNLQGTGGSAVPNIPTSGVPQIPGAYLGMGISGDGTHLTRLVAVFNPGWVDWAASNIFQATPGYGPTINFVARANFRNVVATSVIGAEEIDITANYIAIFGSAYTPGQFVHTRARYVDSSTGLASAWQYPPLYPST